MHRLEKQTYRRKTLARNRQMTRDRKLQTKERKMQARDRIMQARIKKMQVSQDYARERGRYKRDSKIHGKWEDAIRENTGRENDAQNKRML